ncbi:MAG: hypothetical protein A4E55_00299 [Pelotomaculum sp. PtaU1.Bin035]|nr:MAG: hypothetical protein A4E55_00299 [Pelotomaculum sp. PtaU1.Bin035]
MQTQADFNGLLNIASQLEQKSKILNHIMAAVIKVIAELDWDIGRNDEEILLKLHDIQRDLKVISSCLVKHVSYIGDVRNEYIRTENDIINLIEGKVKLAPNALAFSMSILPVIKMLQNYQISFGEILEKNEAVIEPWLQKAAGNSLL